MGAKSAPWLEIADVAAQQHGLVTTAQLAAVGLGRRSVEVGVRTARLHRVHQGVYEVGHPDLPQERRWMAAVLACLGHRGRTPGEAFLSHRSAAALWGMLPATGGPVDVAIIGRVGRNVKVASLTVDFLWRRSRFVVETDGFRAHGGETAFKDDKRRDLRLRTLGYDVLRLTYDQVANETETVVAALRDQLAAT